MKLDIRSVALIQFFIKVIFEVIAAHITSLLELITEQNESTSFPGPSKVLLRLINSILGFHLFSLNSVGFFFSLTYLDSFAFSFAILLIAFFALGTLTYSYSSSSSSFISYSLISSLSDISASSYSDSSFTFDLFPLVLDGCLTSSTTSACFLCLASFHTGLFIGDGSCLTSSFFSSSFFQTHPDFVSLISFD